MFWTIPNRSLSSPAQQEGDLTARIDHEGWNENTLVYRGFLWLASQARPSHIVVAQQQIWSWTWQKSLNAPCAQPSVVLLSWSVILKLWTSWRHYLYEKGFVTKAQWILSTHPLDPSSDKDERTQLSATFEGAFEIGQPSHANVMQSVCKCSL